MMHTSSLLHLYLAATASALDVHYHAGLGCDGGSAVFTDVNPTDCTWGDSPSVAFAAIPSDWQIFIEGYTESGCDATHRVQGDWSAGRTHFCLYPTANQPGNKYRAARYTFPGRKGRSVARHEETARGRCVERQPDVFVLPDGTKYNLSSLGADEIREIITVNATTAAEMPHKYQSLLISV